MRVCACLYYSSRIVYDTRMCVCMCVCNHFVHGMCVTESRAFRLHVMCCECSHDGVLYMCFAVVSCTPS